MFLLVLPSYKIIIFNKAKCRRRRKSLTVIKWGITNLFFRGFLSHSSFPHLSFLWRQNFFFRVFLCLRWLNTNLSTIVLSICIPGRNCKQRDHTHTHTHTHTLQAAWSHTHTHTASSVITSIKIVMTNKSYLVPTFTNYSVSCRDWTMVGKLIFPPTNQNKT